MLLNQEENIKDDDTEFISAMISDVECLQNFSQIISNTIDNTNGYILLYYNIK